MSLTIVPGKLRLNMFDSGAEVLVNPVNCVGVMGAGVAKQFKERYPQMFETYTNNCRKNSFRPGQIEAYGIKADNVIVINAATKNHWKDPSRLKWIEQIFTNLDTFCEEYDIATIAIPALGAGLGGLNFADVAAIATTTFSDHPTKAFLYEPY